MRIMIDHSLCLKSGQCFYMQPEVFGSDDDDGPLILVERPAGEQIAKARDAVAMCPSQAIQLVEGE